MPQINFRPGDNVQVQQPMDPVPAGFYLGQIHSTTLKATAGNTGTRFGYAVRVAQNLGPQPEQYKGRNVFDGINVQHQNKQTEDIGQSEMLTLTTAALNKRSVDFTEELHDKWVVIKVIVEDGGQYGKQNRIKHVYPPTEWERIKAENSGSIAAPLGAAPALHVAPPAAAPQFGAPPQTAYAQAQQPAVQPVHTQTAAVPPYNGQPGVPPGQPVYQQPAMQPPLQPQVQAQPPAVVQQPVNGAPPGFTPPGAAPNGGVPGNPPWAQA